MPRALISVSDKSNIVEFAKSLVELGWDLVSSGGTSRVLSEAGISVTPIEQLTQLPEMLGGRVKTLHPAIHAGILSRDTESDHSELTQHGYAPIKMVVCNLYPFRNTVTQAGVTLQEAVEQIDIGGVTLLRAAAKNFFHVISVCGPDDYNRIIASLRATSEVDLALRRELAIKTFAHTRDYDTAIHAYLSRRTMTAAMTDELPLQVSIGMHKIEDLRYGENPHQLGAYYGHQPDAGPLGGKLLSGKQLSYNNILDLNAAWRAVSSYDEPTVVVVKHLTPTGIASGESLAEAFPLALRSDPVSAFGSVIAVNRPVDEPLVEALGTLFVEAIAAPSFTSEAQEELASKRKNCRLLQMTHPFDGSEPEIRSVHKGLLLQRVDLGDPEGIVLKTVSQRHPTQQEINALKFAWKAVQHVKSNAIVLAVPNAVVGVGGSLPSRVDAVRLAAKKAGDRAKGAVMASDAFFPFADGIEEAVKAGITAIIQPGGSIRDGEVIEAANKANLAMVFTGTRHFRH